MGAQDTGWLARRSTRKAYPDAAEVVPVGYRERRHEPHPPERTMFHALVLDKSDAGFSAGIDTLDESRLPADGDVLIEVEHSTLNYKDGLAITNRGPVVRSWPMVAGIDG